MDIDFGFWPLCDEFSVVHATLLIIGCCNPAEFDNVECCKEQDRPYHFTAAFTALTNAINSGRLQATIRHRGEECSGYWDQNYEPEWTAREDQNGRNWQFHLSPDWSATTVMRDDIVDWLKSRGFTPKFFFSESRSNEGPGFLDRKNEYFAPKLAAAVEAWLAVVNDPNPPASKSPKQRLDIWLRKNADCYGLSDEDGNPNNKGIEEISKVANWKPEGGASKTPQK